MKTLFKRSTILALMLVPMLLAGCGEAVEDNNGTENYPEMKVADYSDVTLDNAKNSQVNFSYPADEWVVTGNNPLTISWAETYGSNQAVNINMNKVQGKAPSNWIEEITNQLESELTEAYGDSFTIEVSEARLLNGETVIYMEVVTKITDAMIDLMLEEGMLTEAQIEMLGGREALLSTPPTTQVVISFVRDGYCYMCTGTYYAEDQKQMVLDTMAIMIGTAEM